MAAEQIAEAQRRDREALPQLSDAEIEKAIRAGQANEFDDLISDCTASPDFGEFFNLETALSISGDLPLGLFEVVTSGNAGRIAFLAAQARRMDESFTIDNVSDEVREITIFVVVNPRDPDVRLKPPNYTLHWDYHLFPSPIRRILLRSKEKPETELAPRHIEIEAVEVKKGGKSWPATRAVATFSLEAARLLTPREVDVVLITQGGERRCKIGRNDRARLFPPSDR